MRSDRARVQREEASIAEVVCELREFDPELEVVVVDDGSADSTAACAAEALRRSTTLTQRLALMEQRLRELVGEHTTAPQLRDVSRLVPISGPSSRHR